MGSQSEDLLSEVETEEQVPCSGFRVKYLGCATFSVRKKRLPKGISSMQRPLLEVYTGARKRGESQRGSHLFALDQRLDVLEYGLVLAERGNQLSGGSRRDGGCSREEELVLIKVLTPLTNAVLWAAVRFQARALRRRVLGAAFVPLACCDAVLDRKGFLRLDAKHRFLVSLSHPSVFACVFRRVTDPRSFECHAFACGSAREALALGSALTLVRERCEMPPISRPPWPPPPQPPPHHVLEERSSNLRRSGAPRRLIGQRRRDALRRTTESEEESNSYASVHKFSKNALNRRIDGRKVSPSSDSSSSGAKGQYRPSQGRREPIGAIVNSDRQDTSNDGRWKPLMKEPTHHSVPNLPSFSPTTPQQEDRIERDPSSSSSAISPSDTSCSAEYLDVGRRYGRRDMWTMTEAEEEKTIDLSSESTCSGGGTNSQRSTEVAWLPMPSATTATPRTGSTTTPVKYTYFGYETYRAPTSPLTRHSEMVQGRQQEANNRRDRENLLFHQKTDPSTRGPNKIKSSTTTPATIVGNGTGRVTINVPFSKRSRGSSSVASSTQTDGSSSALMLLPPRGVRSFRSDRRVADWSTLSQTTSEEGLSVLRLRQVNGLNSGGGISSSSSSSSTSKFNNHFNRTGHNRPQKMLRWRSEDRMPAHKSFFWSLKRLSLQSLTKAKYKTGKFISTMRTKLMGSRRSPEGSEDSAYDTSEVCLSPNGRHSYHPPSSSQTDHIVRSGGTKARRQQSWSFHDLRTAALERSSTPLSRRHRSMDDENDGRTIVLLRKFKEKHPKRRSRRRHKRRHHSPASDSGVEEYYPSDASGLRKSGSDRTDSNKRVTRVQVHHGMSEDTFNRWSRTNIQDELGYIP